ncbi:hypothetical protein ACMT4L_02990 [Deinococcus sp. A31D244]|uniref:hypothetical protein n=1 Tax=Deinococcus sp. A31D244 TaxID=3397675 RepID=UPI0039E09688
MKPIIAFEQITFSAINYIASVFILKLFDQVGYGYYSIAFAVSMVSLGVFNALILEPATIMHSKGYEQSLRTLLSLRLVILALIIFGALFFNINVLFSICICGLYLVKRINYIKSEFRLSFVSNVVTALLVGSIGYTESVFFELSYDIFMKLYCISLSFSIIVSLLRDRGGIFPVYSDIKTLVKHSKHILLGSSIGAVSGQAVPLFAHGNLVSLGQHRFTVLLFSPIVQIMTAYNTSILAKSSNLTKDKNYILFSSSAFIIIAFALYAADYIELLSISSKSLILVCIGSIFNVLAQYLTLKMKIKYDLVIIGKLMALQPVSNLLVIAILYSFINDIDLIYLVSGLTNLSIVYFTNGFIIRSKK